MIWEYEKLAIYDIVKEYLKTLLIRDLNIGNVKNSIYFRVLYHIYGEYLEYGIGVYGDYVYRKLENKINKSNKRKYFYKVLKKLEELGYITIKKEGKFLFLEPTSTHIKAILNLKKLKQNSNSFKKLKSFLDNTLYKVFYERNTPKEFLTKAKIFLVDKNHLCSYDKVFLNELFKSYLFLTEDLRLVFYNPYCSNEDEKYIIMDYAHRFKEYKLYEKIEEIEELFFNAIEYKEYREGVFLTLTLDYKRFRNIKEMCKKIDEGFNRFMSYLKKRLGFRPSYIKFLEFTGKGIPHLHIIIFGVKFLLPYKTISRLWDKYGLGKIIFVNKFIAKGEDYEFKKQFKGEKSLINYLIKYLTKAIGQVKKIKEGLYVDLCDLALYWVTNKRFFTYSRDLKEKKEKRKRKVGLIFIGVFYSWELEDENIYNVFDNILYCGNKINYGVMGYG